MIALLDHPAWALLGLGVAVVFAGLAWLAEYRRRRRLSNYAEASLLMRLAPAATLSAARGRPWRLSLAALCAGAALAGPRWGRAPEVATTTGIDVVLVVDASLSMLATDERPSRLERAKQEIRRLQASGPGDRFALLAFAGRAYVLTPLTTDVGALALFLDNLDPSVVGQPGSVIGPAIRQAREQLVAARGGADRAIVVLSDGEWFDGREAGIAEATSAAAAGLRVITVGFGTTRGTTIALPGGGVKQDEDGKTVVTKYDPAALKAIASAGNGQFIDANANDKASRVRGALSQLRAERRSVERAAGRTPRYQWFLLPAVLLLLLDAVGSRAGAATIRLPRRLATAAAAAVLVMMALWPRDVRADVLADAARDFRAGRFAEAARKLREAIAGGDQRPATIYNLGTALLAADSIGPAIDAFERAARGAPADVRQRALYNLGLAHLKRALQGGDSASAAAQQALAAYKQVLLATPSDAEARWNYELALKLKKDDSGASKPDPSPSAASPKPDPKGEPQAPSQALPKEQAQQLLDNAARDEKDTQGKKQKKGRPDAPPGGKDW